MAWYDVQVPAWIKPAVVTPTEGGNAFAQGLELGIRQQQLDIQKEHYALERLSYSQRLEAIREANVLKAQKQAAEDAIRLRTEQGYAALVQHVATAGKYAGGWNNQEFTDKFWSIAGQYPDLMMDQRFHFLSSGFDRAASMQARKEAQLADFDFRERMAEFAQEGRETVQEMRGRQAMELADVRQQYGLETEEAKQKGRVELEGVRQTGQTALENLRAKHRVEQAEAEARMKANTFLTDRMQLAAFHARLDAVTRGWRASRATEGQKRERINQVLKEFGLTESGTPLPAPTPTPPATTTPVVPPTLPDQGGGFDVPLSGGPGSSLSTPGPVAPAPAPAPTLSSDFEEWLKRQKKP